MIQLCDWVELINTSKVIKLSHKIILRDLEVPLMITFKSLVC
jgi:hypothetical protein